MILKEAKKVGLPVMGLVNSSTPFQIDYPIFAQEQTIQSVHFFCHFLATLIAKEMVYIQHKRYILQKKKRKLKHKNGLKNKSLEPKRRHLMQSKTGHQPF
jgi:ribosomal protein S2